MPTYGTISVKPETRKLLHDSFLPHEDWDDRIRRAYNTELELNALKSLLSRKQLAELESRIRKDDQKVLEVLA
jgi:hypothetical protein